MGTNYYGRQIKLVKELNEKNDRLVNLTADKELLHVIAEYFIWKHSEVERVHIGKCSGGWDFLFNLNQKRFYSNKKELLAWLETVEIYDEYDRPISSHDFWHTVVLNRTWNGKPTMPHRSNPEFASHYIVIDNLEFLDREFF